MEILEKIKIARGKNEEVIKIAEKMKKVVVKILRGDRW